MLAPETCDEEMQGLSPVMVAETHCLSVAQVAVQRRNRQFPEIPWLGQKMNHRRMILQLN